MEEEDERRTTTQERQDDASDLGCEDVGACGAIIMRTFRRSCCLVAVVAFLEPSFALARGVDVEQHALDMASICCNYCCEFSFVLAIVDNRSSTTIAKVAIELGCGLRQHSFLARIYTIHVHRLASGMSHARTKYGQIGY